MGEGVHVGERGGIVPPIFFYLRIYILLLKRRGQIKNRKKSKRLIGW
jgi:hypothetical protein